MKISVMMASGDIEEWDDVDDVALDANFGGAVVVKQDGNLAGMYAPGMWMRIHFES